MIYDARDQRTFWRPKPTIENTPSINIDGVLSAMVDNFAIVRWKAANGLNMIGEGKLRQEGPHLILDYQILGGEGSHRIAFDLESVQKGKSGCKILIDCPHCLTPSVSLFLVNEKWRCRACHKLVYTSQTKTSAERWAGKYGLLLREAERPRQFGEHFATYEKRCKAARHKVATIEKSRTAFERGRDIVEPISVVYSPNYIGPWESAPRAGGRRAR